MLTSCNHANKPTCIAPSPLEPLPFAIAASLAWTRLRTFSALRDRIIVAAVGPGGQVVGPLALSAGDALVVGRHTSCGLHVPDEDVALRHVLLFGEPDAASPTPILHAWDLATSHPMRTSDGVMHHALRSPDALAVTIHSWHLFAILGARLDAEPDPAVLAASTTSLPRPTGLTSITGLRSSVRIGLVVGDKPIGELLLGHDDLSRGFLVGKYDRCHLTEGLDNSISRVHVFILRLNGFTWAFDCASTNGTSIDGVEIRAARLRQKESIMLGDHASLEWTSRSPGFAGLA